MRAVDIKPLDGRARYRYTRDWTSVQDEFVDRPEDAVHDADRLVTSLMHERGYPTQDFEQQLKDLMNQWKGASRVNFPDRKPPARGLHTSTPSP